MSFGYCPRCKSKLYPDDARYMQGAGVCGSCVTFDGTPDRRFHMAMERFKEAQKAAKKTTKSPTK